MQIFSFWSLFLKICAPWLVLRTMRSFKSVNLITSTCTVWRNECAGRAVSNFVNLGLCNGLVKYPNLVSAMLLLLLRELLEFLLLQQLVLFLTVFSVIFLGGLFARLCMLRPLD